MAKEKFWNVFYEEWRTSPEDTLKKLQESKCVQAVLKNKGGQSKY